MNEQRFKDLLNLVPKIPLREFDQNTFGQITPDGCGTVGCVGFHYAKQHPETGLAVRLREGEPSKFSITHCDLDYDTSNSYKALALAFEIGEFESQDLFNGTGSIGRKSKQIVLDRLKRFWREKTGKRVPTTRKAA